MDKCACRIPGENKFLLQLNWTPQDHIGTIAVDFLLIYLQHPYLPKRLQFFIARAYICTVLKEDSHPLCETQGKLYKISFRHLI